ncbi:ABC transporter permease [Candidatus Saccharibacteria bacterium]|nr:ABC transporter permease [Candidatus Saccharibacteria bacterium]
MKKPFFTVITFAKINTRRFFRDKMAIFFSVIFPLIFLAIFGMLYNNNNNVSFRVAVINESDSAFSKQFVEEMGKNKIFNINKDLDTVDKAKIKMQNSELDAAIVLPSNFGTVASGNAYPTGQARVVYTENNQQSATTLASILEAQFKIINSKLVPTVTPFTVTTEAINEKSLSSFDYAFAGLLGFSIIGMGIFGPVNVFPELKKMGILRRLSTTPLRTWQYFLATMIGQMAIGIVSLAGMFIMAISLFHLKVVGNWLELSVFLLISVMMILGIGLAIGGWAKNERQAAPLSNIVVFPMMFLSGTFFPRFAMPELIQAISSFFPLTPVIDGIRLIASEGRHLTDILPQVGLIGAWFVIIYVIAFRVFRWE